MATNPPFTSAPVIHWQDISADRKVAGHTYAARFGAGWLIRHHTFSDPHVTDTMVYVPDSQSQLGIRPVGSGVAQPMLTQEE